MQSKLVFNSQRARELIKERGRTRVWIAEQCGIKTHTLDVMLTQEYMPSRPVIKLLALALECQEDDLLIRS